MHVCLGGLALELQSRRLLTNGIVKRLVKKTIANSSGPITAQPVQTWGEKNKQKKHLPSTCHTSSALNLSIIYSLLPDVHTCVNASECTYACVQHVVVYVIGMHMRLSEFQCVFYPAGTNWWQPFAWISLVVRDLFFLPELNKLEFIPMSHFISSWISSLTTFDLSDSYEWQACLLAHNVLLTNYRKK